MYASDNKRSINLLLSFKKKELEYLTIPSIIIRFKTCFIAIAYLLTTKDQLLSVKERIITLKYPIY